MKQEYTVGQAVYVSDRKGVELSALPRVCAVPSARNQSDDQKNQGAGR